MLFNVEALKAAAQAEIDATRQAHETYELEKVDKFVRDEQAWIEEYGPVWLEVLPKLRAKLRRGMPLYSSDLPTGNYRGSLAILDRDRRVPVVQPFTPPYELVNLLHVLGAVQDEAVSTSALTQVGVTREALRSAVQRLGRANREMEQN